MNLLTDFINSILIIDDKDEEVEKLKQILETKDLYVVHEHPDSLLKRAKIHRKDLIFLDFMLDDKNTFKTILSSLIRPIFKKHFSDRFPYGIVLWTKHEEYVEEFFEKLKNDTLINKQYTSPMFIISLDKTKYLHKDDFSTIFEDIETELSNSFSASFFINWKSKISNSIYTSVSDIFHLTGNYTTQDTDVKRIIYKLAVNKAGISEKWLKKYIKNNSLSSDAYKAFDDLLYSNLNQHEIYQQLFLNYSLPDESSEEKIKDAALINTKMFLEIDKLDKTVVVPGNIYKVLKSDKYLKSELIDDDCTMIAIELTPPCDFSQDKKNHSKLIGGYIKEIKEKKDESIDKTWNKATQNLEYRYLLWPLYLSEYKNYCLIAFDFHCEKVLSDNTICSSKNFELLYRAKTPLFADILQKYSSNKARLGISSLVPQFKKKNKKI